MGGQEVGQVLSLTCIGVLCETKALWPACISVIDKAEVQNLAGAAEQLADLLFGQSWAKMWSVVQLLGMMNLPWVSP